MEPEKFELWQVLEKYDFWKAYVGFKINCVEFKKRVDKSKELLLADGFSDLQIEAIKRITTPELHQPAKLYRATASKANKLMLCGYISC